jgi:uncharacterized protein DUF5955
MKSEGSWQNMSVEINGDGNVVGNNSSSYVSKTAPPEILTALNDFIRSLARYGNDVPDSRRVRADAEAARSEVAKPEPRWDRVRQALGKVANGVAGVAALSDIVNNIINMLPHL